MHTNSTLPYLVNMPTPQGQETSSLRLTSSLLNTKTYCTLLMTSYCALRRKDSLCALARRFSVSIKGGIGEVGGVTCRVLCTWQLLGLAVKAAWLPLGWPIFALHGCCPCNLCHFNIIYDLCYLLSTTSDILRYFLSSPYVATAKRCLNWTLNVRN